MPTIKVKFTGRSYRFYDTDVFKNELVTQDWDEFYANNDPDKLWEIMLLNINNVADWMCPMKNVNIKKYRDPWVTPEILELIRDKDQALKKAKRTKNDQNWKTAKRLRNSCLTQVRKAKGDLIRSELDNNKSDSKKFRKKIHEIIPKNNKEKNKIELGNQINSQDIPENKTSTFINNFFSTIGSNLAKNFNQEWDYSGTVANECMDNVVTNIDEITNICKEIDIYKSAWVNSLSSRLLKDALLALGEQFVCLVNNSFRLNIFPKEWKKATVIPLFKGGNSRDVSNYRPISLLPLP